MVGNVVRVGNGVGNVVVNGVGLGWLTSIKVLIFKYFYFWDYKNYLLTIKSKNGIYFLGL